MKRLGFVVLLCLISAPKAHASVDVIAQAQTKSVESHSISKAASGCQYIAQAVVDNYQEYATLKVTAVDRQARTILSATVTLKPESMPLHDGEISNDGITRVTYESGLLTQVVREPYDVLGNGEQTTLEIEVSPDLSVVRRARVRHSQLHMYLEWPGGASAECQFPGHQ